jgi:hypothetical protein
VYEHQTIVERSIEREMRERLRSMDDYWRADRQGRDRIEKTVRESIRLSKYEDEA